MEQKQQRTDGLERMCLRGVERIFLRRYIKMDETWIHRYTPESKRAIR